MIKISIRDIIADLPPALIRKKIQEMKDDIKNITGYENYTPDKMEKLHEMHRRGIIESHPVFDQANDIIWTSDINAENGSHCDEIPYHRPNNLPAVEFRKNSPPPQYWVNDKHIIKKGFNSINELWTWLKSNLGFDKNPKNYFENNDIYCELVHLNIMGKIAGITTVSDSISIEINRNSGGKYYFTINGWNLNNYKIFMRNGELIINEIKNA